MAARKMTKAQAEKLWSELADAFNNIERVVKRIIETEAWIPLGYDTFADAWADRMSGVKLAPSGVAAGLVVYRMIDEGLSDAEISIAVKGVGGSTVKVARENKKAGREAESITKPVPVRSTRRNLPSQPHVLRIKLAPEEYAAIKNVCKELGVDLEEEVAETVRKHYLRLAKTMRAVA